jgi:hypothetical protein
MTEEYTINSIHDIIEIGTKLSLSWFRGHPESYNNLTPGIFRDKYASQYIFKPQFEMKIYEEFKRIAPSLSHFNVINYNDLEWLFVMQHYGMPTRLLDWTESILFAAYFAVEKSFESNGELWSMYPDALNHKYGFHGMPMIKENRALQFLASEHRHNDPPKLLEELGLKELPKTPMALKPPIKFDRMILQQSAFTIHPKPEEGNSITDILKEKELLIKYTIPNNKKQMLKDDLKALGVNRRTLFGDLQSLTESILYEERVVAYGPPKPPDLLQKKK